MNITYNKCSLLDDFDVLDQRINKNIILDWINDKFDCQGLEISDSPNKDGLYEVNATNVIINTQFLSYIDSLTNGMFIWKNIVYDFDCSYCDSLTSLEGAPEKVGGEFCCSKCKSLTSLKGAPKKNW